MAFCPGCGSAIEPDTKHCPECGRKLYENEGGVAQPYVAQPQTVYSPQMNMQPVDNGSFGWAVLGFFLPVVGLVLFLVWKDEKPKSAKQAGLGAFVCVVLSVVLAALCVIVPLLLFGGVMYASI